MHGVFVSFKLRVEYLNNDTMKLLATTTRVEGKGGIDLKSPKKTGGMPIAPDEFLDFSRFGDVNEVASNLQELLLTPEEVSARQRAVTMVEADLPPRLEDEWSFTNGDGNPLATDIDAIEEMRTIFDDPREVTNQLQEVVIPDIIAPPVKPRIGSNPRIEVTPAITEERRTRISPVHAPNLEETAVTVAAEPNLPDDVFRAPEVQEIEEGPPQIPDIVVTGAIEPQEKGGSPSSMELAPVQVEPRRKKRKVVPCIHLDQETQIPSEEIRNHLRNYEDLIRPRQEETARILRPRRFDNAKAPGRTLGFGLGKLYVDAINLGEEGEEDGDQFDCNGEPLPMEVDPPIVEAGLNVEAGFMLEVPAQDQESLIRDEGNLRLSFNTSVNPLTSTLIENEDQGAFQKNPVEPEETGHLLPPTEDPGHAPLRTVDEEPEESLILPPAEDLGHAPAMNVTEELAENGHLIPPAAADVTPSAAAGYDEFSGGLSPRKLQEATAHDEGFDETTSTMAFISRLGGQNLGKFTDLVNQDTDRREVARTFLQMLVAHKQEKVKIEQEDSYDTIKFEIV